MSPANIDDASSPLEPGAARPLTRKEIRAREKTLNTGHHDAVPEQAYETGHDVPPLPSEPPAVPPAASRGTREDQPVPAAPDAPPSIQETQPEQHHWTVPQQEPHHDEPVHHEPVQHETVQHADPHQHAEPHHDDVHHDDVQHGGLAAAYAAPVPAGHADAAGTHYAEDHHYADQDFREGPHHDEAYHDPAYHDDFQDTANHGAHEVSGQHHGFLPGAAASVVAKPSKKVRRRRRMLALFLTLAVFVTAVAVGAQFLKPLLGSDKPSDFPGPGTGEVVVTVENGEGTRSVASKLESERVVANADTFLQSFSASGGTLAPGDYTFKTEMKNSDAVNVLLGKDQAKVIYFALSAGLRIGESLQAISEGSGISIQDLQALSNQPAQFGLPANAKNLEGYLAPGEHRFPLGTPAKDILQALVKITVDELESQGITDPAKQYEAVIVASIVQAEGGQAEYGDVAGAIYNRLKPNDQTNGFLQVDSAVTYGLGTKSYNFTEEQRQDKSNPYNTYANPGLPPGPIGSPGKTAIDAAAKPKTNDYLYWVTINLDTKETKFSKTLAEHNGYVEQYNAWCMANPGRCT
ncbi:endolytic transglycosylase MltG [Pseudarthrobacter phenanthrenivorans]|uniref:endolytic transglycosylase MltG n=1 Tax=Pseudarthrobacter phenanthrenivorans TaxID=361575 RepID=UPI00112991E0|nr:endolytic transglycosylase MltG [Pseudarthrobacter phenanthrenivorans]TPV53224.1 endolytic transglycosylase MltG [Pseudarthrobacter phenanthrenivorans]